MAPERARPHCQGIVWGSPLSVSGGHDVKLCLCSRPEFSLLLLPGDGLGEVRACVVDGRYGCGAEPMVPFWGRCTPSLVYFSWDWDVHLGYGILHCYMHVVDTFTELITPYLPRVVCASCLPRGTFTHQGVTAGMISTALKHMRQWVNTDSCDEFRYDRTDMSF